MNEYKTIRIDKELIRDYVAERGLHSNLGYSDLLDPSCEHYAHSDIVDFLATRTEVDGWELFQVIDYVTFLFKRSSASELPAYPWYAPDLPSTPYCGVEL